MRQKDIFDNIGTLNEELTKLYNVYDLYPGQDVINQAEIALKAYYVENKHIFPFLYQIIEEEKKRIEQVEQGIKLIRANKRKERTKIKRDKLKKRREQFKLKNKTRKEKKAVFCKIGRKVLRFNSADLIQDWYASTFKMPKKNAKTHMYRSLYSGKATKNKVLFFKK